MIKKLSKTNVDEAIGKINKAKRAFEKSVKKFKPKSKIAKFFSKHQHQNGHEKTPENDEVNVILISSIFLTQIDMNVKIFEKILWRHVYNHTEVNHRKVPLSGYYTKNQESSKENPMSY